MNEVKGLDEDIKLPSITIKYYIKNKPKYATINQDYDCELLSVFFENNNTGETITLKRFGDVFEWILRNNYKATKHMKEDWKGRLKYFVIGLAYLGNKKLMKDWEQIWKDKIKKNWVRVIECFFSKYYDTDKHLNPDGLSENDNITSKFMYDHSYRFEIGWIYYVDNKNMSENILREHLEELTKQDWSGVSLCKYLPESFYEDILKSQYASKLVISNLCYNTNLSDRFFVRLLNSPLYRDKIDWYGLCYNSNISVSFYKKYKAKINWRALCNNKNIPSQFFLKNLDKLNKDAWNNLCRNNRMSESFYESIFDSNYRNKLDWDNLCRNENLTEKFYEKYIKYIVWETISIHPNISEYFYEKYIKYISIPYLCRNKNVSPSFFNMLLSNPKYSKQIQWEWLCENTALTDKFVERLLKDPEYKPKILWVKLCGNTNLSPSFFKKHIRKLNRQALEALYRNTNMTGDFFDEYIKNTNNPRLINKLILNEGLSPVFLFSYSKYFEDGEIAWNSFDVFKEKKASIEVKKLYKQFGVDGVVHMTKDKF